MRRHLAIALGASVIAVPALAAAPSFGTYDTDGDGRITSTEFYAAMEGTPLYGTWDANGDGSLSNIEFMDGLYASWDDNEDGAVSVDEFSARNVWFMKEKNEPSFEAWNTDGNSQLSQQEFRTGVEDSKIFETWDGDTDGVLSRREFAGGLFGFWDYDDNGQLSQQEFDTASDTLS